MLPCNVIIQELGNNKIIEAAVDPAASMMAVDNKELAGIAGDIRAKLERVIASLQIKERYTRGEIDKEEFEMKKKGPRGLKYN